MVIKAEEKNKNMQGESRRHEPAMAICVRHSKEVRSDGSVDE